MKRRKWLLFPVLLLMILCAMLLRTRLQAEAKDILQAIKGKKTVADRVQEFGDSVWNRLSPDFQRVGMEYPPDRIVLVGLKQERVLEVWVSKGNQRPRFLKSYPVLGASGTLGPKLREGDLQVPEGLYRIDSLNPNSLFHLALRVNYPNPFDKAKGKLDGRTHLGGDIMIHGKNCSIGCLAMGDRAAEELFVLAARTGIQNISVILAPVDLRTTELPDKMPDLPAWAPELYDSISAELNKLGKTTDDATGNLSTVPIPAGGGQGMM